MPFITASVNILFVSWNDALDKNESVSKLALVIPKIIGLATAGLPPLSNTSLLTLVNSLISILVPGNKSLSPDSRTVIFLSI